MAILNLKNLTADEKLYLKAKEKYYKGDPIMTDAEFDALEDTLRLIDSFVIDFVGSTKKKKNMIKHTTPMGSLAKIQFKPGYVPYPEFKNWLKGKTFSFLKFEPKLDGNAINCIYEDGELKHVLSRGDGEEGQDYKDKLTTIPRKIKGFSGEIRGEAVVDVEVFNIKYKKDGTDPNKKYTNARNFVAGILNSDFDKTKVGMYSDIEFIAFDIADFDGDIHQSLIKWGFETQDFVRIHKGQDVTEQWFIENYEKFVAYRKRCKFQLDGFVCKTNEDARESLGKTSHHPNWALAIKFITDIATTKIIDIRWTLGKTGQLTPTAILEPITLMDSTVQKATVYNASWMIENKCYPGAVVSLIKSGDIIPKITQIVSPSSQPYTLPTEWQGQKVTMGDVHLTLDNFETTDVYKAIKLWSAINCLGFKGIGPATCELLIEAKTDLMSLLSDNPDGIRAKLLQSKVFKDGRELELLIENLFELTKVELWQCIYAMGWRNCGETISRQLANWMTGIKHDFRGLEKVVVESFINDTKKQDSVKQLVGILLNNNVAVEKPKDTSGLITFEMTGEPTTHTSKSLFKHEVEQSGKVKHSALKSDTTYLVTNSKASITGKMQKAEKNGTKIVTYDEFLDIVKSL